MSTYTSEEVAIAAFHYKHAREAVQAGDLQPEDMTAECMAEQLGRVLPHASPEALAALVQSSHIHWCKYQQRAYEACGWARSPVLDAAVDAAEARH